MGNLNDFNYIYKFPRDSGSLVSRFQNSIFWNNYDSDLNNNWVGGSSDYGWWSPELRFSFSNQYLNNFTSQWFYDLSIEARVNWGFSSYSGIYDENKLIWNDNRDLSFIVAGNFLGINDACFPKPFTAHASTNLNYLKPSWPKDIYLNNSWNLDRLGLNINSYTNATSIYKEINKDLYIHNFNNFTNGIPIKQWIEIYNTKNLHQFISNYRGDFNFQGYFSILENSNYYLHSSVSFNNYFGFYIYDAESKNYPFDQNKNYNIVIFYNNGGLGDTTTLLVNSSSGQPVYNNNIFKKVGHHYTTWANIYNLETKYNTYAYGGDFYYSRYGDAELIPQWEANQYNLYYYILNNQENAYSWERYDNIERIATYGAPYSVPELKEQVGYHFSYWTTSPTWLGKKVNVNENCLIDLSNGNNLNLYAIYEKNTYTVTYKSIENNKEIKITQNYNHDDLMFTPENYIPSNNLFNGWRFENNKKLINGITKCTENYNLISSWNADTFSVNYSFPIENKELKEITDNYNIVAQNIKREQNDYYIEQIWPDWDDFNIQNFSNFEFRGWLDEYGRYYFPGQKINQSVNLFAWNNADPTIGIFYLSIFEKNDYIRFKYPNSLEEISRPGYWQENRYSFEYLKPKYLKDLYYGIVKDNLISAYGGHFMYNSNTSYTTKNLLNSYLNYDRLYPYIPIYFTKTSFFEFNNCKDSIFPILLKPGYKFNGWWYNNNQFTDSQGYKLIGNYTHFTNFFNNNVPNIVNNIFYPEFINIMNEYYFPYVLTNRNIKYNETELDVNDYERVITTNWLNKKSTYNNSFHFPSLLIPYNEQ